MGIENNLKKLLEGGKLNALELWREFTSEDSKVISDQAFKPIKASFQN